MIKSLTELTNELIAGKITQEAFEWTLEYSRIVDGMVIPLSLVFEVAIDRQTYNRVQGKNITEPEWERAICDDHKEYQVFGDPERAESEFYDYISMELDGMFEIYGPTSRCPVNNNK